MVYTNQNIMYHGKIVQKSGITYTPPRLSCRLHVLETQTNIMNYLRMTNYINSSENSFSTRNSGTMVNGSKGNGKKPNE